VAIIDCTDGYRHSGGKGVRKAGNNQRRFRGRVEGEA
jgi:hypothetical protein